MRRNKSFLDILRDAYEKFQKKDFRRSIELERKKRQLFSLGNSHISHRPTHYLKLTHQFRPIFTKIQALRIPGNSQGITMALMGGFLISISLYILFFSPYFTIAPSKIIIERTDAFSDISITARAIDPFLYQNLFFINTELLREKIMTLQKNLESVTLQKLYPQGLKIIISSYPPVFRVRLDGSKDIQYILTKNGTLMYVSKPDSQLPLIDYINPNVSDSVFKNYRSIITAKRTEEIINFISEIKKLLGDKKITKIRLFSGERELHIALENGTIILFHLQFQLDKQLESLYYFLRERGKIFQNTQLRYLDVRVAGKIFTCTDTSKCDTFLQTTYGSTYAQQ